MKGVCFGLLVVFFCQSDPQPVVSDFCKVSGTEIKAFYQLSDGELRALKPTRKRAMLKLRQKYERLC